MQASLLCSYLVAKVTNLRITDSVTLPSPVDLCEEISRSTRTKNLRPPDSRGIAWFNSWRRQTTDRRCRTVFDSRFKSLSSTPNASPSSLKKLKDRVLMIMRVYFEKPRTTVGWKGLIMDPQLNGTCDIPKGLRIARTFLGEVLDQGIPTATEFLDPITPQYYGRFIMLGSDRCPNIRVPDSSSDGIRAFHASGF